MKEKAFTLVELLAVIVILAVILVIAIPQIMNVIKASRISSFKDSAILIATNAEKDYLSNQVLDENYKRTSISCSDVVKLNDDYSVCSIKYDEEGNTVVKLKGRLNSKFEGLICEGTKDNMECIKKEPRRCRYEGSLTVGSEFVDGQYTYRYKQHYDAAPGIWKSIGTNGWGVTLTDRTSTTPVTTELCTTINDKPIVSMWEAFYNSKAVSIDLSSFDTSNVTTMSGAFYGTASEILDVSGFDTSNVKDMSTMFYGSSALNLDLSSFDTSKVTNMDSMFMHTSATKIRGIEVFNTKNVTSMYRMFAATKIEFLDLSNFDTSNVTSMHDMFIGSSLTKIKGLENFNTSKVTNMHSMFNNTKIPIIDLSSFDTSKVTNKESMFAYAKATTVYARNEEEIERLSNGTSKPATMNIVLKNS